MMSLVRAQLGEPKKSSESYSFSFITLDEFGDIKEIHDPEEVKRSWNELYGR